MEMETLRGMAKMKIARLQACMKQPYLTSALFSMPMIESTKVIDPGGAPTLGVDKWGRLYFHPDAVDSWSYKQLRSVLVHEVWHILRLHWKRFEGKNPLIANMAEDMEINDGLIEVGGFELPGKPLLPRDYGYPSHLLAEEYYDKLIQNAKAMSNAGGDGPPGTGGDCGSITGGPPRDYEELSPAEGGTSGMSPLEQEALRHKVAQELKSIGNVEGDLARWADDILEPPINPLQILRKFATDVVSRGMTDYSWQKANRRFSSTGFTLPSIVGDNQPVIAFVVDTSGSMDTDDLALCLGTIRKAMKGGARIKVFVGDVVVHETIDNVKNIDDVRRRLRGGGGTDMGGIMIDIAENVKPRPKGLIVITDGWTDWPQEHIGIPSAAIITRSSYHDNVPAWIKRIQLKDLEKDRK